LSCGTSYNLQYDMLIIEMRKLRKQSSFSSQHQSIYYNQLAVDAAKSAGVNGSGFDRARLSARGSERVLLRKERRPAGSCMPQRANIVPISGWSFHM